jgi:hypothetical protein
VSKKHLARYVDEVTFRLNDGNVKRHTLNRLDSLIKDTSGKRITYKQLTALNGEAAAASQNPARAASDCRCSAGA